MCDSLENKCGLTQLLLIQMGNDFCRTGTIAQNKRMKIAAQCRFDCGDKFMRNIELGRQRTGKFKLFTL